MIKVIAFIKRKPGLSEAEFAEYWGQSHPPFVSALPGIRRYRQNHPIAHRRSWPFDGVAEVWFDDVLAVKEAFGADVAERMREDETNFIGEMSWLIANEHEIQIEGRPEHDAAAGD